MPISTLAKGAVVAMWALKYDDWETAAGDFALASEWARQNCGFHSWVNLGESGIIRCSTGDGFNKTMLNGQWLVDILAFDGSGMTSEDLVDEVSGAIAMHWDTLANR